MKNNQKIWLCIRECDVESSSNGAHLHYFAGEFVMEESAPCASCFLSVTTAQHNQLQTILKSIKKEKVYQEKQHLAIRNSHPRPNWKAEQRLDGSIQEARSMRARFNRMVSEIAGKEIEVFWDCRTNRHISW